MRRRVVKPLACLLVVFILGAPVAADDFTGSETQEQTLNCPAPGQSVPANQEPPGPGECTDPLVTTYQGKVWTNDVKCNSGETANVQGVRIYHSQSGTTSGGLGTCNDGTGAVGSQVIQGRIVAEGSTEGGRVYADGDKDNTQHEAAQGWLRAEGTFGPSAPTVRCGDAAGKRDATQPEAGDGQDDCG